MSSTLINQALSEAALHEQAIARTGLSDFGETSYREGLGVLIRAFAKSDRQAEIAPRFVDTVLAALTGRLASQAGWNANPEVLGQPVRAPLIITGLPRSGTTILHQVMSADPQFQWLPRWVAEAPLVRPRFEDWEAHPQFQAVKQRLEALFAATPDLKAIHDMGAERADECIIPMSQSFMSNLFNSSLPLPEYRHWWFQADETPSYRRYRDNLALIGAREPEKTWLLKNPSHTYGMEELLRVFPDARIVVLHRHPVETIASGASLTWSNGHIFTKQEAGELRLQVYSRAAERLMAACARHPEAKVLDVHYRDLIGDQIGTVRRIYHHFGLNFSEEAQAAMQARLAANPQGKHGKHRYSSEDFGFTDDDVRQRFADYIAHYQL
jgi:hypothetical protein